MGDSDEDYTDIGDEDEIKDDTEGSLGLPEKTDKSRGKDIEWIEIARYEDKAAYENSTYFLDINKYFTTRKGREKTVFLIMNISLASIREREVSLSVLSSIRCTT